MQSDISKASSLLAYSEASLLFLLVADPLVASRS